MLTLGVVAIAASAVLAWRYRHLDWTVVVAATFMIGALAAAAAIVLTDPDRMAPRPSRRWFAAADGSCPECGYGHEGLEGERCPECRGYLPAGDAHLVRLAAVHDAEGPAACVVCGRVVTDVEHGASCPTCGSRRRRALGIQAGGAGADGERGVR
jgi:predicted Zn-ribbon and HTH transcriptional regulator